MIFLASIILNIFILISLFIWFIWKDVNHFYNLKQKVVVLSFPFKFIKLEIENKSLKSISWNSSSILDEDNEGMNFGFCVLFIFGGWLSLSMCLIGLSIYFGIKYFIKAVKSLINNSLTDEEKKDD